MTVKQMADRINQGGYGFRLEKAGAGWNTTWVAIDKQSGLASPMTEGDIRDKYDQLGLDISDAARALRAIPSDRRSEQSRINGRKGGRPRKNPIS